MRYVTVRLVPEGTAMNRVEGALADEPPISREAMHHIRILEDRTGVVLCELSGDRERTEAVLAAHPDVHAFSVSTVADRLFVHIHQEFPGPVGELLEIPQRMELIVDTPMAYDDDGSVLVTVIGDQETIQQAMREIPTVVDVEIEATGRYRPEGKRLFASLTPRQQEAMTVARDLGYFADPREATYDDIAAVMDCRPETVGEHLRKAQATLVDEIVP